MDFIIGIYKFLLSLILDKVCKWSEKEHFNNWVKTSSHSQNDIVVVDDANMSFMNNTSLVEYSRQTAVCLDDDSNTFRPVVSSNWLKYVCPSSRDNSKDSLSSLWLTSSWLLQSFPSLSKKFTSNFGRLFQKIEADSHLRYPYSWNQRNVYKQEVYRVFIGVVWIRASEVRVGFDFLEENAFQSLRWTFSRDSGMTAGVTTMSITDWKENPLSCLLTMGKRT